MASRQADTRRSFWLISFLYAIPVSFVVTLLSTILVMQAAVAMSAEGASPDEYLSAFFSSVFITLLIYVGFCYLIVPVTTLVVGAVRLRRRSLSKRRTQHDEKAGRTGRE